MKTNHQMNYYDYGKNLDIQGVMPVMGGGVNPDTLDYVDLGLSVKWATCNIGANTPEEAGLYFAWGETQGYTMEQVGTGEGKKEFSWDDYEFGPESALTKYNGRDGKTVLDAEDDAATVNLGEEWRMPTKEEIEELVASASTAMTIVNGVSGVMFTSTVYGYTDKSVFFPTVGTADSGNIYFFPDMGKIWSSSLDYDDVKRGWELGFGSSMSVYNDGRHCGYSVRPVRSNN